MINKKLLDRLLGSRIFWGVLSVAAAVVLWMYVTTNEQTETSTTINNVPIVFVGEDALRNKKLVITDIETTSVNLTLHGSRRALSKLTDTNVIAQIDVSMYSHAREMRLNYEIIYPNSVNRSEITRVEKSAENIAFTIDTLVTRMVPVKIETNGTIRESYIRKEPTSDPQTVQLTGASGELEDVDHALVTLEYENLSRSIEGDYNYVLIDKEGRRMEVGAGENEAGHYKTIERERDSVFVRLPVQMIKDVVLAIEFAEGGGATGSNTKTSITPATVSVAGEPEELEPLNRIILGKADLTEFLMTYENDFDIKYPNNVELISGETTAHVKIEITGLYSRKISTENIVVSNVPEGYTPKLITNSLEVTVRGPQSIVSLIKPENIRVVADFSAGGGNGAGTRSLPARVSIDGYPEAGVVFQSQYRVVASLEDATPE